MNNKFGIVHKIYDLASKPEDVLDCKKHGVEAHEVKQWLECFADGIDYIFKRYGHMPNGFGIFNSVTNHLGQETGTTVMLDAEADFIVVTRNFIAREIKNTRGLAAIFGNSNTGSRSDFTGPEMFTLLGVEEAYHSYQYQHMQDKYSHEDWQAGARHENIGNQEHYENNPVERDASIMVLKAADDLGFGLKNKAENDNDHVYSYEDPALA